MFNWHVFFQLSSFHSQLPKNLPPGFPGVSARLLLTFPLLHYTCHPEVASTFCLTQKFGFQSPLIKSASDVGYWGKWWERCSLDLMPDSSLKEVCGAFGCALTHPHRPNFSFYSPFFPSFQNFKQKSQVCFVPLWKNKCVIIIWVNTGNISFDFTLFFLFLGFPSWGRAWWRGMLPRIPVIQRSLPVAVFLYSCICCFS